MRKVNFAQRCANVIASVRTSAIVAGNLVRQLLLHLLEVRHAARHVRAPARRPDPQHEHQDRQQDHREQRVGER